MRSSVLLPQPLLPMTVRNWPAGTCRSMPCRTPLSPKALVRPRMSMATPPGGRSGARRTGSGSWTGGRPSSSKARTRMSSTMSALLATGLEGGMPLQRRALQQARGAVGELAEQGVEQDRQDDDVELHELAG